jgi:hypothetical protein
VLQKRSNSPAVQGAILARVTAADPDSGKRHGNSARRTGCRNTYEFPVPKGTSLLSVEQPRTKRRPEERIFGPGREVSNGGSRGPMGCNDGCSEKAPRESCGAIVRVPSLLRAKG